MKNKFDRIYIELTNRCNFNCPFCAQNNREKTDMNIDFFERIVGEVKEFTNEICLHVLGEPLLYSEFDKAIYIANKNKLKINLVSNGFFVVEKLPVLIKNASSFFKICFSLHSYQYRAEEDSQKILEILEASRALSDNGIIVELRLMFETNDEMLTYNTKVLSLINNFFNCNAFQKSGSYKLCDNLFLVFKKEFEWPEKNNETMVAEDNNENLILKNKDVRSGKKVYCLGTKSHIGILANGTVVPCCLDANGKIDLGNLHNSTLENIFKSERFLKINTEFGKNCTSEKLCKKCTYNKKF